jgi:hypothetical protein
MMRRMRAGMACSRVSESDLEIGQLTHNVLELSRSHSGHSRD